MAFDRTTVAALISVTDFMDVELITTQVVPLHRMFILLPDEPGISAKTAGGFTGKRCIHPLC